jgi:EAL domain-containing protein (putative c-di-GMP-specific phosphodiesterase class I)/uncharacterized membrane protein affecting hemolysin expression
MRFLHALPSLKKKLTLAIGLAIAAASVLVGVASVFIEAERHTAARVRFLETAGAVFASASSSATANHDQRGALRALRAVGRIDRIAYARIYTADGSVLAEIGSAVLLESQHAHLSLDTPVLGAGFRTTLSVRTPIVHAGAHVGVVELIAENADLGATLARTIGFVIAGAGLAATFCIALVHLLVGRMLAPLSQLTRTVQRVTAEKVYPEAIHVETQDEIGKLCVGFNDMMVAVRERDRTITDLAMHDSETDLPNRVAFEQSLYKLMQGDHARVLVVATLGIERFQALRGAIGYAASSDLVATLGVRMQDKMPGGAMARLASDVLVFAFRARSVESAEMIANAAIGVAESPVTLGASKVDVSVRMGLAVYGVHADTAAALIERASIALDQARAARTKCLLFDPDTYGDPSGALSLMSDLRSALRTQETFLALQPKWDLRRNKLCGAEALMRWKHPEKGFVSPDLFIPMAEETGLIRDVTTWTIETALDHWRTLRARGIDCPIAVNLSGRLIGEPLFIEYCMELAEEAKGALRLEITETALIDDPDVALANINALRAAGIGVSIDDYGSGWSSLAYLKQIPADELKIDKSYITNLLTSGRDALLVKSTIDLGHSLGMTITAEGVEDEATRRVLSGLGCDRVQGYLISKPLMIDAFVDFIEARAQADYAADSLSCSFASRA